MKIVFSLLIIFLRLSTVAQNVTVTNTELKALIGKWSGPMVATAFVDGKNQHSYTTELEVVAVQDSLMFNFTFTGEGKQLMEKYPLYIYDNSSKLTFDSTKFEITEISRRGNRLVIYAEREGYEQTRKAEWQDIFIIAPGSLNITKGIRYEDMVDFSIRQRLTLTKK